MSNNIFANFGQQYSVIKSNILPKNEELKRMKGEKYDYTETPIVNNQFINQLQMEIATGMAIKFNESKETTRTVYTTMVCNINYETAYGLALDMFGSKGYIAIKDSFKNKEYDYTGDSEEYTYYTIKVKFNLLS